MSEMTVERAREVLSGSMFLSSQVNEAIAVLLAATEPSKERSSGWCEFCDQPSVLQMLVDPFGKSGKMVGRCAAHSNHYVMVSATPFTPPTTPTITSPPPLTVEQVAAQDGEPMQPIVYDEDDGVIRFRTNAIVRFLFDNTNYDLNWIATAGFTDADRRQFAQLIGYSVSGYGDLSYVGATRAAEADRMAAMLAALSAKGGGE